jgi:hypothetical protein
MIVAVTGTRNPPVHSKIKRDAELWLANYIAPSLRHAALEMTEFRNGVQRGMDTIALREMLEASMLTQWRGNQKLRVYVPKGLPHNDRLVRDLKAQTKYNYLDLDVNEILGGYLKRNHAMLTGMTNADLLLAYPKTGKEIVRSGTWATVRQARKQNVRIWIVPLDGSADWKE